MNDRRLEDRMKQPVYFEERRKYPRYSIRLPLEYWRTDDVCRGGMVGDVSETGLLIHSLQDVRVGEELNVRIFFPNGYELDGIKVTARIVWKDLHHETDWKGFKYGVEFAQISEEDRLKLANLIRNPPTFEAITAREEQLTSGSSPSEKPDPPPLPALDLDQMKEDSASSSWSRFKTKILSSW